MNIWQEARNHEGRNGLDYLFGNGILNYTEKGKSFLAVNEGFYTTDEGEQRGIFRVHTGNGKSKERRLGTNSDIQTFSPHLGVLNGNKGVVLTKWVARRQYVRVLNRDTLHTQVLYDKILSKLGFSPSDEVGFAYPHLLQPEYPSVQEALQKVLSGEVQACAFNNKYYLANSPYSDNIVLGYKEHEVGEYVEKASAVKLYPEFVEKTDEVRKFFKV